MKKSLLCRFSTLMLLAVLAVSSGMGHLSFVQRADAASLTALSDTMSSLKVATASSHMIRFTTATGVSDSTDTIIVNFNSDFDFSGKSIGSVTFTHGASTGTETVETLAGTATASAWGASFSGGGSRILTLVAPTDGQGVAPINPGDKLIITYDSTNSVNPAVPGSYTVDVYGMFGDMGSILVSILNDDQVSVTATVSQTLTFNISDNTIGFGNLSPSESRFATGDGNGAPSETEAHNFVVDTNAASGYTTTVKGPTLTYGSASIDAIGGSNTASTTGMEQFGIRLSSSGGVGTVTAPYAASGFAYGADANTASQVASSSGASTSTTYSVRYLANIATGTEAGNYNTTLTYVTTANF